MKILITGGSRGIGKAIAKELIANGHDVLLVAKTRKNLERARTELMKNRRVSINILPCDLSKKPAIKQLHRDCQRLRFAPNVLILNAGIFIEGGLVDSSDKGYEQTLMMNLNSAYYIVKEFLPQIKAGTLKKIVLIGSTAGHEAYPVGALYGVAKWGLRGYAINLRQELIKYGVAVTLLSPGGTLTDLWEGEELPPKRLLEPSDLGKIVACILTLSDQAVVEDIVVRPMLGDFHD
jgi:short-subunit dehydrogenase